MPKKYPTEERRAALGYLNMYSGDIDTVHQITGIPHRTLRRWRKQMETKTARRKRKSSAAVTTRSHTPESGHLRVFSRFSNTAAPPCGEYGHIEDTTARPIGRKGHNGDTTA